ncbi:hypothetical protein B0F90DRAFT_1772872 [Multifurca ochricompacta]|uniref:Uncharacterized protein n=1 Tax=Multifurca ochricompacta TaxID=376703 RepID=A0AAD4QI62_9AGAM|nr:hypothetical protein B0F90DRAFT_1772872 [Multifurca ochricompacta]
MRRVLALTSNQPVKFLIICCVVGYGVHATSALILHHHQLHSARRCAPLLVDWHGNCLLCFASLRTTVLFTTCPCLNSPSWPFIHLVMFRPGLAQKPRLWLGLRRLRLS